MDRDKYVNDYCKADPQFRAHQKADLIVYRKMNAAESRILELEMQLSEARLEYDLWSIRHREHQDYIMAQYDYARSAYDAYERTEK